MGEILVFDIEADGLLPNVSEIWILGVLNYDTDEYTEYRGDDITDGLMRLLDAELVIGHCIKSYDLLVIDKLTHGLVKFDRSKCGDTCEMSRTYYPDLENHKLRTWGDIFGFPKGDYDKGFDEYNPEMSPYCERDVRLTAMLLRYFVENHS